MTFRVQAIYAGLVCLQFALTANSFADDFAKPDVHGVAKLSEKTENGKTLQVRITLRDANKTDRDEARVQAGDSIGNDWWGAPNDGPPDHIISTFEVRIGKEFIPLFRSAYSDLGDVRDVRLATSKAGFVITVYGGDTGSAYTARLRFQDGYLIERDVTSNEMGMLEKTEYFPVHDN